METILSAIADKVNREIYTEGREIYTEFITILLNQFIGAHSITWKRSTLGQVLELAELETMAFHLSLQLHACEMRGFTLLFWQPSDILVMQATTGETLYILAGLTQRVPLDKKDQTLLYLVYPTVFPLPCEWCAPELLKMDMLPFLTHRSASYYSLALFCLSRINLSLAKLEGTKLFYFLERCLKNEPSERMLLYL